MSDKMFVKFRSRRDPALAASRKSKRRVEELTEQGLCTRCGVVPVEPPFKNCEACRADYNVRYRKGAGLPMEYTPRPETGVVIAAARRAKAALRASRKLVPGRTVFTPKTGNSWKPEERELLIKLFAEKAPIEEICAQLGRSERSVIRYGRMLNIPECDPQNFASAYAIARIKSW